MFESVLREIVSDAMLGIGAASLILGWLLGSIALYLMYREKRRRGTNDHEDQK
jgi:hypothetical protein